MDEYLIVPKRIMDQKLTQIQINKAPPEALGIVNLDTMMQDIMNRKDLTE